MFPRRDRVCFKRKIRIPPADRRRPARHNEKNKKDSGQEEEIEYSQFLCYANVRAGFFNIYPMSAFLKTLAGGERRGDFLCRPLQCRHRRFTKNHRAITADLNIPLYFANATWV